MVLSFGHSKGLDYRVLCEEGQHPVWVEVEPLPHVDVERLAGLCEEGDRHVCLDLFLSPILDTDLVPLVGNITWRDGGYP